MKAFLSTVSVQEEQLEAMREQAQLWIKQNEQEKLAEHANLEVAKVDERLSRFADKFVDDLIDDETYHKKKRELLLEKTKWLALVKKREDRAAKVARIEKLLELLKNAYSAYCIGAAERKREIMKFASSNLRLVEEKLVIEPSNAVTWLFELANLSYCDPCRPSSRTFESIDKLIAEAIDLQN